MSEFLDELARAVAQPNSISRRRTGRCCGEGATCCAFVDDKKNILRVNCCASGQRCRQGVCV
jgi:hypothetical protein